MKAFIITLSKVDSSYQSALLTQQALSEIGIQAEMFEGSYGDVIQREYQAIGRKCHSWGLKGPGQPFSDQKKADLTTPGVIGCFDSHYRLWQKCVELNEPIMIFEDDIIVYRPFVPVEFDDVLSIAFSHAKKMIRYQDYLDSPSGDHRAMSYGQSSMPGNGAYCIKPHAAAKLVEEYAYSFLPADNAINQHLVKIQLHSHMIGRARTKHEGNVSLIRTEFWQEELEAKTLNIVCVLRAGGKVGYNASWVEKLQNAVERHVTRPYRFICLSDCDVPCKRIPLDPLGHSWWAKMQLFKPGHLKGPTLFLDLDTIIFGNLDEMIDILLEQKHFVMWRDDTVNISSSAIMYWNGDYSRVYEEYASQPEHYENLYSQENQGPDRKIGDQALISSMLPHIFINDLVPKGWIRLINKRDNQIDFTDSKILIFKKLKGKPSNMPNHKIVRDHWK